MEAAGSVRIHCSEYTAYYQAKLAQSTKHAHKRALVLTARKLVRLVDTLLRTDTRYQSLEQRRDRKEETPPDRQPAGTRQAHPTRPRHRLTQPTRPGARPSPLAPGRIPMPPGLGSRPCRALLVAKNTRLIPPSSDRSYALDFSPRVFGLDGPTDVDRDEDREK